MSTDSIAIDHKNISNEEIDDSSLLPILPRSSWSNQVAFLRVIFRAKKALDKIEQEAKL